MIELLDLEGKMICNLIQIEQTAGETVETTQSLQDQRFSLWIQFLMRMSQALFLIYSQSILPTGSRVQSFQYLYGHPVQMNVYGHSITYGTIGTVVAGILAAFASKILLQEISAL